MDIIPGRYYNYKTVSQEENSTTDNMRQVYRSRGLSITKYSPGGGNWRQNVDHITNHIKVGYLLFNTLYIMLIFVCFYDLNMRKWSDFLFYLRN